MTSNLPIKKQVQKLFSNLQGNNNILSEVKGNRLYITFNRPKRYNAFSSDMYYTLTNLLQFGNQSDAVKFIILSGNGGNFSSGNDLQNFGNPQFTSLGSTEQMSRATAEMLSDLNEAIILSKKPIFAITEGKVIGFAFTQLLLYDRVFSVASSEFNAPLVKLAQGPEMCASYTFPKVFGRNVGEDLLVKGTKVDSSFLEKYGVVTSVKTRAEAEFALNIHLEDLDSLDWVSYLNARKLFRDLDRATLLKANAKEVDNLVDRWCNPELPRLLMEYMSKVKLRSKL